MHTFKNPLFIKSAILEKDYPQLVNAQGHPLPEIAIAGRSNVGKSSLINHLLNRKDLAKTSARPGKTQLLNFFTIDKRLCLVDLPGYGFADVPEEIKKQWGPMVQNYLQRRASLKLIVFLLDIRRLPNKEDLQLIEWAVHYEKALIFVLTKTDKVSLNEKTRNTEKIMEQIPYNNIHYTHYSIKNSSGKTHLTRMIEEAILNETTESTD